jgi:hypothetical protein
MNNSGKISLTVDAVIALAFLVSLIACSRQKQAESPAPQVSKIKIEISNGGRIVLKTANARFEVLPSETVHAALLEGVKELTLEHPESASPAANYAIQGGKQVAFTLDLSQAKIDDATGKLGLGKRVTVPAKTNPDIPGLAQTLQIEAYDDFPNLLLTSSTFSNKGNSELKIDQIIVRI